MHEGQEPEYKKSLVIRHMDALLSRMCGWREGYRCFLCGKIGCDTHHWGYSRGLLHYRWHLNNVIFLCRKCHTETELDRAPLLAKLAKEKPDMVKWYEGRRPDSEIEPVPVHALYFIYDSLKRTANEMGIPSEIVSQVPPKQGVADDEAQ